MKFQINHILTQNDATIKLLSYHNCEIEDLNLGILSGDEVDRFNAFKSKKRQLEFYFTRFLWSRFSEFEPITYEGTGKPHLRKGYISISHSRNNIAIAYSPVNHVGVDLEHYNPKIFKIAQKFLSTEELDQFDLSNEVIITTLWSIKEALYKVLNIPGLIFRENIIITSIGEENSAEVHYQGSIKTFLFQRITYDEFILTYCSNDILL